MSIKTPNCRIWLADRLHLHERGFESFFEVAKADKIPLLDIPGPDHLRKAHGAYESHPELKIYLRLLDKENYAPEDLARLPYSFMETPLRLFPLVRAEFLSLAMARGEEWINAAVPGDDDDALALLAARRNPIELTRCYAAAMFWIDHYARMLPTLPPATHCLIFSGSLIYQRVLLEILKMSRTKTLVVEHFMTGADYYLESRTTPIANASDFRHLTIRNAIQLPAGFEDLQRERVKASLKLIEMQNKNVKQPAEAPALPFSKDRPTLLILGQVQNDFSILEARLPNINHLNFWVEGIRSILKETDANIVFKAHPWERHKANIRTAFTRERLEIVRAGLSCAEAERLVIVEDANIEKLAAQASHVLAICSQGALELAFRTGHKPVVFGRPFYGSAGFTHDYEMVADFVRDLKRGQACGTLSLDEFEALEMWLTKFIIHHLACVHPSGHATVRRALAVPHTLRIDAQAPKPEAKAATLPVKPATSPDAPAKAQPQTAVKEASGAPSTPIGRKMLARLGGLLRWAA